MKRRPPTAVGGVLGGKITGLPAGFLYKSFATPPLNGQVFGGVRKDANHNCLQFKNSICLETFHLPFKIAHWENTEEIGAQPGCNSGATHHQHAHPLPGIRYFCFMWVEIAIARDSPIEYGVSRQITAKYWGGLVTQRVVMRIFLGVSENGRIEMAAQSREGDDRCEVPIIFDKKLWGLYFSWYSLQH